MPWRVAKTLYGPYKLSKHFELAASDDLELVDGVRVKDIRPALQWALSARTLLTLGVLVTLVRWVSAPMSGGNWLDRAAVSLFYGPFGLWLGAGALVLLARPGHRRSTRRAVRRPCLVALLAFAMAAIVVLYHLFASGPRLTEWVATEAPWLMPVFVLLTPLAIWYAIFLLCSTYLMHHNGFADRGHPLLRPITSTWLAWVAALLAFVLPGWRESPQTPGVVIATLLGPTLATLISIWEWRACQK